MREAYLFVAVLPCSKLIFADVFRDEKHPSWIKGHLNAFTYYGGVPKTVVPVNLKTGVAKAQYYEPSINRSYQELASYYWTVILSARVRKPRDKGAISNNVRRRRGFRLTPVAYQIKQFSVTKRQCTLL